MLLKTAATPRLGSKSSSRVHTHLFRRTFGQPRTPGAERWVRASVRRLSTAVPQCAAANSHIPLEETDKGKALEDDFAAEDSNLEASRVATEAGSRKKWAEAFAEKLGMEVVVPNTEGGTMYTPMDPYTIPLSDTEARRRRNYFFNRDWTATDIGYAGFFIPMHLIAFVFGPLTFTPEAFTAACVLYVITGGLGLSMSYHRQLSHKSFRCPKVVEYFLAYCGVLAFEGDPIEWSKNHNWHHRYTDTEVDRHTPKDGFWHSHMGWLFDEQLSLCRIGPNGNIKQDNANSVPWFYQESPRFYQWIRETYMWHQLGQAALLTVLGGASFFVWAFVIRVLVTMHMTWLVNSAVHVWGRQAYRSQDNSRNNMIVALLVFGDGWHNNHHAFEYSARHGLEWWQIDASWYIIALMERLGLAWDVKIPSSAQKNAKRISTVT